MKKIHIKQVAGVIEICKITNTNYEVIENCIDEDSGNWYDVVLMKYEDMCALQDLYGDKFCIGVIDTIDDKLRYINKQKKPKTTKQDNQTEMGLEIG